MLGLGTFISRVSGIFEEVFRNTYSTITGGSDEFVRVEGNAANQALWPNSSGGDRGWSISFWLKSKESKHLFVTTPQNKPSMHFYLRYNGNLAWRIYGGRNSSVYQHLNLDTTVVPSDNSMSDWRHIVLTFNLQDSSDSMIAYLDGTKYSDEDGNATYSNGGTWTAVTGLWNHTTALGGGQGDTMSFGYASGTYSDFSLDEVAVFDDVLNQTQVNSLYNDGEPTTVIGVSDYLTAWWRMGDSDVHPDIVDNSDNDYDMKMMNMESSDFQEDVPPSD